MKDDAKILDHDEIEWSYDDILYSRTNDRGLIQITNASFQTLAGYSEEELSGAPHRIIRHPAIPKGVFWLYWDKLKRGENVCAYIKNKSKDGKGYWVMAVVMPCEDGYLSMRFNPQGPLFFKVKAVYAKLLEEEKEKHLTPEASASKLLDKIKAHGFDSYEAFMVQAMKEELQIRYEQKKVSTPGHQLAMEDLVNHVTQVKDITQKMSVGFRNIRGEPINMRILAGRIEGSGAAVSSISQNYEIMAAEMWEELNRVANTGTEEGHRMEAAFLDGQLSLLLSDVLAEAVQYLEATKDTESDKERFQAEQAIMSGVLDASNKSSMAQTQAMVESCQGMPDMCRRLRRRVNGLDVVKLFCRVESGRMSGVDSGLEGIIERLNKFHSEVDRQLAELSTCARSIVQSGRRLKELMADRTLKRAA